MRIVLNKGRQYEQPIEIIKEGCVVTIIIGRTSYNEHDVDISITTDEFKTLINEMKKVLE